MNHFSLFTHCNGKQVLIVGLINLKTDEIRLEIDENKNRNTMRIIIENHMAKEILLILTLGLPIIFWIILIQDIDTTLIIIAEAYLDLLLELRVFGMK